MNVVTQEYCGIHAGILDSFITTKFPQLTCLQIDSSFKHHFQTENNLFFKFILQTGI